MDIIRLDSTNRENLDSLLWDETLLGDSTGSEDNEEFVEVLTLSCLSLFYSMIIIAVGMTKRLVFY